MGTIKDAAGELAYLREDLPADKVTREVALADFKRFLVDRNLLKKTVRKAEGDDDTRENFESAKEILLRCIMDGSIVVTDDKPCKLIHNLIEPIKGSDGSVLHETLEYGFVPSIIQLRKLDSFGDNESMGKTQALLSAMTNKSVKELGKVASTDLDVVAAVAFFFA